MPTPEDLPPVADVVIAGAGPAGLVLAAELGLAGVDSLLLEASPGPTPFCRGFNLNARSLELLDRRGLADRMLAEGPTVPATTFAGLGQLDLTALRADHPYVLGIAQTRVEELLRERAAELGVPVRWAHRVTGLTRDSDGVDVTVETPAGVHRIRTRYLAGCDGGRSTVRRLAGIDFPGTPTRNWTLLGDVELADPDALRFGPTVTPTGSVFTIPRPGYVRLITAEPEPPADRDAPVTLDALQAAVDRALGRHVRLVRPRWLTRFGDAARQAARYVDGRVVLAGDAAHIHPPAGALGVNVAIDDAVNLGWKLAGAVRGWAPETLLDSYHRERHAAGVRLLRHTRAQTLLGGADEALAPVRELLAELLGHDDVNRRLAELVTGVDTRYPPTDGHPWLGRLVPDLPLTGPDGRRTRLAALLRGGRGVLLDLAASRADGGAVGPDIRATVAGWRSRVTRHAVDDAGTSGLDAVLIRPDGHAAWLAPTGGTPVPGPLADALHAWFGRPDGSPDAPERALS